MIRWEKKYETGVAEIDHQHKWLFDFVNDLEEKLNNHEQLEIDHVLKSMEDYARKHFGYEEKCMYKWKCPVYAKNKEAHTNFIKAYENFMSRYEREGHSRVLAWKIHNMVEKWITDHICRIDMKLKTCRHDIPQKQSSSE